MKTNLFSADTTSNCNQFPMLIAYGKQDTQKVSDGVNMVGIVVCDATFSDNNNENMVGINRSSNMVPKKGYTP